MLAMNVVGEALEASGFEFLAVNSKLKKDPQFVCLKEKKTTFCSGKRMLLPQKPKGIRHPTPTTGLRTRAKVQRTNLLCRGWLRPCKRLCPTP